MEKKEIDKVAREKKKEIINRGLMPVVEDTNVSSLVTGILHRTGKSQQRFLKHLHHDYDIDAGIFAWNNPENLEFVKESLLGEGKDLTKQENLDNIERKKKRKVEKYHVYRFAYKERTFLVKMEKLTYGKEQFYSLMEE